MRHAGTLQRLFCWRRGTEGKSFYVSSLYIACFDGVRIALLLLPSIGWSGSHLQENRRLESGAGDGSCAARKVSTLVLTYRIWFGRWSCAAFFRWAVRWSMLGISSSPSVLWVCPPIAFARPLCVVTLALPASTGTMGCKLCNDSPLVSVSWSSIADLKTTVVCVRSRSSFCFSLVKAYSRLMVACVRLGVAMSFSWQLREVLPRSQRRVALPAQARPPLHETRPLSAQVPHRRGKATVIFAFARHGNMRYVLPVLGGLQHEMVFFFLGTNFSGNALPVSSYFRPVGPLWYTHYPSCLAVRIPW